MGEDWYRAQGIEIVDVDRGGKITYHGPGQLVGYPIVRVDDVVAYVRTLEQALVAALAQEGVAARARPEDGPDYTGVWVQERKIASIGVHLARGRDHPRVGGQRRERPAAVLVGGALRPGRRADDLADQGDRPAGRARCRAFASARRSRWRGRWAAAAAGVAGPARGGGRVGAGAARLRRDDRAPPRCGVRPRSAVGSAERRDCNRATPTRSRSNPGGIADVLTVLGVRRTRSSPTAAASRRGSRSPRPAGALPRSCRS